MPQTEPRVRRWSRAEYYRLADMGFFRNQRVELIHGRIVKMPPMKNDHAVAVGLVEDALRTTFSKGYWVRVQMPLAMTPTSEPEPDLAVVPGRPRDYTDHPTKALLVVEVSDTTLWYDRGVKARLYAAAGVADYWVLDLPHRGLGVYRDPRPDPSRPQQVVYTQVTTLTEADTVSPLAAPKSQILVADLLP
jgi:Uma2 family endonuclease